MSFVIGKKVVRVELPSTMTSSSVGTSCTTTIPAIVVMLDGGGKQGRMNRSDIEREAGIALATMKQQSCSPVPLPEGTEVFLPKNKVITEEMRAPPPLPRFRKTSYIPFQNNNMKRSERMLNHTLARLEYRMKLSEQTARRWCNHRGGTMSGNNIINKYDTLIPDLSATRNKQVQKKPVKTLRRRRPIVAYSKQFFRLRSKMRLSDMSRRMLLDTGREIYLNKLARSKNQTNQEKPDTSIHSLSKKDVQLLQFGSRNYQFSGVAPRCYEKKIVTTTLTTGSSSVYSFLKKKQEKIVTGRKRITPVTP